MVRRLPRSRGERAVYARRGRVLQSADIGGHQLQPLRVPHHYRNKLDISTHQEMYLNSTSSSGISIVYQRIMGSFDKWPSIRSSSAVSSRRHVRFAPFLSRLHSRQITARLSCDQRDAMTSRARQVAGPDLAAASIDASCSLCLRSEDNYTPLASLVPILCSIHKPLHEEG